MRRDLQFCRFVIRRWLRRASIQFLFQMQSVQGVALTIQHHQQLLQLHIRIACKVDLPVGHILAR